MLQVSSALGSLNVGGTLDVTNAALLLGTNTLGMAFDANQIEQVGNSAFYINYNSASDIRMAEGGGEVGIGKNPTSRLDIEQTANNHTGGIRLNEFGARCFLGDFL